MSATKGPQWVMKFKFWEVQDRERVAEALNIVKAQYGLDSDSAALLKICELVETAQNVINKAKLPA